MAAAAAGPQRRCCCPARRCRRRRLPPAVMSRCWVPAQRLASIRAALRPRWSALGAPGAVWAPACARPLGNAALQPLAGCRWQSCAPCKCRAAAELARACERGPVGGRGGCRAACNAEVESAGRDRAPGRAGAPRWLLSPLHEVARRHMTCSLGRPGTLCPPCIVPPGSWSRRQLEEARLRTHHIPAGGRRGQQQAGKCSLYADHAPNPSGRPPSLQTPWAGSGASPLADALPCGGSHARSGVAHVAASWLARPQAGPPAVQPAAARRRRRLCRRSRRLPRPCHACWAPHHMHCAHGLTPLRPMLLDPAPSCRAAASLLACTLAAPPLAPLPHSAAAHRQTAARRRMADDFYVRYYVGHKGKFGHGKAACAAVSRVPRRV